MNRSAAAPAQCVLAAAGLLLASALSCGDDTTNGGKGGSTGGTQAEAGESGGGTAGRGGATDGGAGAGGEGGAAGSGSGADCARDDDCVPLNNCYAAACQAGLCLGSPLARGSACGDGFCNGFGRCLPCLDDASGAERDSGCSADSPVCPEGAACVGCTDDAHCDDGVECTVDRCASSECENEPLDLGTPCVGGFCDGESDENSCARCVDDASAGFDRGCTLERPRCDTDMTPPSCSGCESPVDCYDDNECTSDECFQGVCGRATILGGTPCTFGYCNGIRGAEACVPKACQTDPDCDDRATCSTEVCRAGFCDYTTNDSQCSDSGDACKPNRCTVGTGCQQVDISRSLELLSNGYLDAGEVDWEQMSATGYGVIFPYDYIPTLFPHTEVFVAWLGSSENAGDSNSLSQTVAIPAGTVRLELSFFYQVWTEALPDDTNRFDVRLLPSETTQSDLDLLTLHNQDQTRIWTGFRTTIDASSWAGSDATLEFAGASPDSYTAFFVDSISLVATVCE